MNNLLDLFNEIDQCNDEAWIDRQYAELQDANVTKVFWDQRTILLQEKDPLLRKKALLKCRMINKLYSATVSVSRGIHPFRSPHGFNGIHISQNAKVGKGCTIFQHVVIGSNTLIDSKNRGFPTVGNNVYIGAGAMIIGNVRVGDNCRIAANAVVVKDVPDNSVVRGGGHLFARKRLSWSTSS